MNSLMLSGSILFAILLGSAAIAKTWFFSQFITYLDIPFGVHAHFVGIFVVGLEIALSICLIIAVLTDMNLPVLFIITGCFFLVATAVLAYRLVLEHNTNCGCWGVSYNHLKYDGIIANIIRPMWYGLRNGILLLGAWTLFDLSQSGYISLNIVSAISIFAVCPLIMATGLIMSIFMQWRWLKFEEHPLKKEFAPRLAPLVALSWYMNSGSNGEWIST